jgi:hypothetical protein
MAARKRTLRKKRRAPVAGKKARPKKALRPARRKRAQKKSRPERAKPKRGEANARKGARVRSALATSATRPKAAPVPAILARDGKPAPPKTVDRFAASIALLESEPARAGVVLRAFPRAKAALVALEAPLALGDRVHVRGATTDFVAELTSLRSAGAAVALATSGEATLELPERVRPHDVVYVLRAPK